MAPDIGGDVHTQHSLQPLQTNAAGSTATTPMKEAYGPATLPNDSHATFLDEFKEDVDVGFMQRVHADVLQYASAVGPV